MRVDGGAGGSLVSKIFNGGFSLLHNNIVEVRHSANVEISVGLWHLFVNSFIKELKVSLSVLFDSFNKSNPDVITFEVNEQVNLLEEGL